MAVGGSHKKPRVESHTSEGGPEVGIEKAFQKDGEGLTRHSYCEINSRMPLAPWAPCQRAVSQSNPRTILLHFPTQTSGSLTIP